jgi:hypothetical protein
LFTSMAVVVFVIIKERGAKEEGEREKRDYY